MSKKKGTKTSSAKGHIESNVIRWREKRLKYRIDREGNPLNRSFPVNTFSREWLAKQLLETGGDLPPVIQAPTKPPDNVTNIDKHKGKPASVSGNEAEALPPDKGKLTFDTPPSTVRNPMLSAKPVVVHNKQLRGEALSPSGMPISEFTEGKYKPPEKKSPVVYTTEWPFVKQADPPPAKATLPPTASKHWQGEAANDGNTTWLRKTPSVTSIEHMLNSEVQWFINKIEPQNWPNHIHNFAHWKGGDPTPNTGAINKAAAEWVTRYKLMKSMYDGVINDWKMLDSALEMSNQEVRLLRQELEAERQANSLMEYELAHRSGVTSDDVREAYIKSKTPEVPDDADEMVAQFRVHQAFVTCDGPEHAFARYVYGDPRLGEVIRDHADMRCRERQEAFEHREHMRHVAVLQAEYEKNLHDEYVAFWDAAYDDAVKRLEARKSYGAVHDTHAEVQALATFKQRSVETNSIYYRVPEYLELRAHVDNCMAGRILREIFSDKPKRVTNRTKYEKWWAERLDYCEVKYHETYALGRAKIAVVKSYNKIVGVLNTPVDYGTRKHERQVMARLRKHQAILDEQRERRKEARAADKQRKAERKLIREAQRIAH